MVARYAVHAICGAASPQGDAAVAPVELIEPVEPIKGMRLVSTAKQTRKGAAQLLERTGFGESPSEVNHALPRDPRTVVAAPIRPQGAANPIGADL